MGGGVFENIFDLLSYHEITPPVRHSASRHPQNKTNHAAPNLSINKLLQLVYTRYYIATRIG